jgi:transposase
MWEEMYVKDGLSIANIADRLQCGTATVNRRLLQAGFTLKTRGGARLQGQKRFQLFHMDQRLVHGLKTQDISDRFDISYAVVYHYKKWKCGGDMAAYARDQKGLEGRGYYV